MRRIYTWDWRFRLFFDSEIQLEVKTFVSKLNIEQAKIYNAVVDFYLSFFSFGVLLDAILQNLSKLNELLDCAYNHIDKIVKTPYILSEHYKNAIDNLQISELEKQRLNNILMRSLEAREVSTEYVQLNEVIFGEHFPFMREEILHCQQTGNDKAQQLSVSNNIVQEFNNIYDTITKDARLIETFGSCQIKEYDTVVEKNSGFAEWWNKEISQSGRDTLVLFDNADALKKDDFFYTIIHETYPGHGHFYCSVLTNPDNLFDHGAMSLIEGWATFCEWNSIQSDYSLVLKQRALSALAEVFTMGIDERAAAIMERKKLQGYSLEESYRSIIYATQYIGRSDSYYLGALGLEVIMTHKKLFTPKLFLVHLSKNNGGEFFALWR